MAGNENDKKKTNFFCPPLDDSEFDDIEEEKEVIKAKKTKQTKTFIDNKFMGDFDLSSQKDLGILKNLLKPHDPLKKDGLQGRNKVREFIEVPSYHSYPVGKYDRIEERVKIKPHILRKVSKKIREKIPEKNLPDYIIGKFIGGNKYTTSNALNGSS